MKLDIQALQKNLEVLSASVNEQKKQYNNKSLSVEKQAADEVSETARIEAEKRYPYPPEPEKPEVIKREEAAEKERIKRLYNDILNCFRKTYNPMTVKDISDHYMGQMSTKDIIAALNYGKSIGTFYRQQVKNYVYWCLN